jgi:hypothetical protein
MVVIINGTQGHDAAHAVSRLFPYIGGPGMMLSRVGILGGVSDAEAETLLVLRFPLPSVIQLNALYPSIVRAWYSGPTSGLCPKWTQSKQWVSPSHADHAHKRKAIPVTGLGGL